MNTPAPNRVQLPYRPDGADYFALFEAQPWAMFLDSGPANQRHGRWDIIVASPRVTLVSQAGATTIETASSTHQSREDPLSILRRLLGEPVEGTSGPFSGGAVGYFAYDLGRQWMGLPAANTQLPEMAVGIYDWAIVVDHYRHSAELVRSPSSEISSEAWATLQQNIINPLAPPPGSEVCTGNTSTGAFRSDMDRIRYSEAFQRVQHYIREGDCYQVNLAQRFEAPLEASPWHTYQRLRQINPAPFAAYLNYPFGQVLSASPERFLELRGQRVQTKPIKGTRPRMSDPASDAEQARQLHASTKDRAENLMIVDLLRNDLGKVCIPGSVQVEKLFEVEHYANVHHLVSTVTGQLSPELGAMDLLHAAFPGGSITGAPKRRAMEIIDELEVRPRELYCGSIGYIGFDGNMDTNIAIRSLVVQEGLASFWAGGGLVADSECDAEYQECLDKARPILRLLGLEPPLGEDDCPVA